MSIAEIIQQRFKNKMKVNEVKTPQEVASVIIKSPEDANLIENFEGSSSQQEVAQNEIKDIETNKMYTWSDMSQVKKELWNKLHAAKELMKKKATNLAQLISRNANHIAKNYLPENIK